MESSEEYHNEVELPAVVKADARKRAWRTLKQNIVYIVVAQVLLLLVTAFTSATSWNDVWATLTAFSSAQAVFLVVAAYVQRIVFNGDEEQV